MDKNRKLISNKPENYKYIVFDPNYQGVVLTSNDYNEVRNFAQNNKGIHIKYQDTTPRYNNLVTPTWTNRNAYFNQLKKSPDVVILDNKQKEIGHKDSMKKIKEEWAQFLKDRIL